MGYDPGVPPSPCGRSWDYLPAHPDTSFFGITTSWDHGRRHRIAYIDDFPIAASTCVCDFSSFLRQEHEHYYAGGPELLELFKNFLFS
jgi:hypothetical protein